MTEPKTDEIVQMVDGTYPNKGKRGLCRRCGGDPKHARGYVAIGTIGCVCEHMSNAAPDVSPDEGGPVLAVFTNGVDFYACESPDEFVRLWEEQTGLNCAEECGDPIRTADPNTIHRVVDDSESATPEALTAAEWAAKNGRGYLFTRASEC